MINRFMYILGYAAVPLCAWTLIAIVIVPITTLVVDPQHFSDATYAGFIFILFHFAFFFAVAVIGIKK